MLITGEWFLCPDGVARPIVRGEVLAQDGSWVQTPFLVDTAADRTVFSANILGALHLEARAGSHQLGGVGGIVSSVVIDTEIHLFGEDSREVLFRGQYAAVLEAEALDMSVLGRDITNLFAVIVDRAGDAVYLVGQRHRYKIDYV
jgi:hypothetical protein